MIIMFVSVLCHFLLFHVHVFVPFECVLMMAYDQCICGIFVWVRNSTVSMAKNSAHVVQWAWLLSTHVFHGAMTAIFMSAVLIFYVI